MMKNKLMRLSRKIGGILPALALILAAQSVTSACFYFLHQPDVPEELL